jgi:hypothetical protein
VLLPLRPGDRVTWGADPTSIGRSGIVERILSDEMADIVEDGTGGAPHMAAAGEGSVAVRPGPFRQPTRATP